ncbi:hypothetical protein C8R47DRAFT_1121400 [Mycena vitilis]|nr:hypothetical protein C8R47DRAFT_1121400 [Mycena vitilis]
MSGSKVSDMTNRFCPVPDSPLAAFHVLSGPSSSRSVFSFSPLCLSTLDLTFLHFCCTGMGSLENENHFLAFSVTKVLESSVQDKHNAATRAITIPLLPANGGSPSSALKRKHSKLELSPCRTPDRVTLTLQVTPSIPLLAFSKPEHASHVHANTINDVETLRVQSAASTTNGPDAKSLGMGTGHAAGEGPHDLPAIEILPEIVSPVLSTRRAASPSSPIHASAAPPPAVSTVPFINAEASASAVAPPPPAPADSDSRPPERHANTYAQRYLRPPLRTTTRRLAHPYPKHELDLAPAPVGQLRGGEPRQGVESAVAWIERVREEIGATETEVDVDAKRGWRVQSRPNTAPSAAYAALLEDAFGPGRVLRGEGEKPVAVLGKRGGKQKEGQTESVSGSSRSDAMEVDGYGEQASEAGWSATGSGSGGSVAEAMDVDIEVEEESANTEEGAVEDEEKERARPSSWVAEIQVLIKGKRKLAREEFKSLANTLRLMWQAIAEEGRPLGVRVLILGFCSTPRLIALCISQDDGPPLFDSLWQLAQLEDIPFRDEYKVRSWARRLLKYWPE